MNKIPVTILTGFLGAGKTTLLNKIIRTFQHKKIAVIENEFGEIGIDSDLVIGAKDDVFELSNGCICCTLNSDMLDVLEKILSHKPAVEHVIIETTGIADPAAIVLNFLSDPQIVQYFEIDGIVAVADSRFLEQQLENEPVACRQIALADVVLFSKTDLVDPYIVETLQNIVRRMNADATFRLFDENTLPDPELLSLKSFAAGDMDQKLEKIKPAQKSIKQKLAGSLKPLANVHAQISSKSFVFDESFDPIRFTIFIRLILNEKWMDVYRMKGIICFADMDDKVVLQGVNNEFLTQIIGQWKSNEIRQSKLVFIGRNLLEDVLEKGLQACCSTDEFVPEEYYKQISETLLEAGISL
jgi:G3E family GTPase